MGRPVIINFAPTGLVPSREMTRHAPLQPDEIVAQVCEANELGITMAHLHARDHDGLATQDPEIIARIIEGIRAEAPDLVLCVSVSGRRLREGFSRTAPLSLAGRSKPDMASLTLGSLNFAREVSENSPAIIQELSCLMLERGIMPELEIFDLGMINYAHYLIGKRLLRPPYYFNILLGNLGSAQCDLLQAGLLVRELPKESQWAFAGVGRTQLAAATLAIASGGGVRVGLEDNIYFDQARQRLATNMDLLRRVQTLAEMFERPLMPPAEFRAAMKLGGGCGDYGREPVAFPRPALA